MKKRFKNLSAILVVIMLIATFFSTQAFINYGNNVDGDKVSVKIIRYVDGKKVAFDTTIVINENFALKDVLSNMILSDEECNIDSLLQTLDIFIESDEENGEHAKMIVKIIEGDKACNPDSLLKKLKIDKNGTKTLAYTMCVELDEDDINIDIDSLLKTYQIDIIEKEAGEHELFVKVIGDDSDIDIDSLIKNIDVEIIEDEDGATKIITIIKTDEKGETNCETKTIVIDEDGKTTNSDENVEIYMISGDDSEKELQVMIKDINCEGIDSMISNIDIDIDTINGKVIVKYIELGENHQKSNIVRSKCIVIKLDVKIGELNNEDLKILKKTGVPIPSENTELKIDELKFYPNPNDGKFNLSFQSESKSAVSIKIYDISGKEVYSKLISNFDGAFDEKINISDKGKGNYFINISQNDKVLNRKIVIQ